MDYSKIAEEALKSYSIKSKSIEFIAQSAGVVYKVTDDSDISYCLKLYISINDVIEEKNSVNTELEWVAAIARDTDITVPEPYENTHGEYITVIDGISCSLTKWLDGRRSGFDQPDGFIKALLLDGDMDEFDDKEDAINYIKVLGKLHRHASEWKLPVGFARGVIELDEDGMAEIFSKLDALNNELYNKNDIEIIKMASKKAFEKRQTIDKNNMTWGLVHNDYVLSNYLIDNHEICPIDFGACGFNYYLSDLSNAIHFVAPHKRKKFFDLYSEYFPLPDNYVALTETLYIIAELQTIGNYLNLSSEEKDDWFPKDVNIWANAEFKHYLNDEPYLFDKKAFYQFQF